MASKSKHALPAELEYLHQDRSGGGGKGCLTRHQRRETGHHCSHQWQAGVKANSMPWKRKYSPPGRPEIAPGYQVAGAPANFEHFKYPYWHNAHHIVPNGTLNTAIAKTGPDLCNLIKQGLLKAEYNLNDKVNMVILPMERKWGVILGLPRHLKRDEDGGNSPGEFFSHADYSNEVELALVDIIASYKQIAADAKNAAKEHEMPDPKLSKKQLETLSARIHNNIMMPHRVIAGESLSAIVKLIV